MPAWCNSGGTSVTRHLLKSCFTVKSLLTCTSSMCRLFCIRLSRRMPFDNFPYSVFSSSQYRTRVIGSNLIVNTDIITVLDRKWRLMTKTLINWINWYVMFNLLSCYVVLWNIHVSLDFYHYDWKLLFFLNAKYLAMERHPCMWWDLLVSKQV